MAETSPFPHPWWSSFTNGPRPLCVNEWLIVDLLYQIREKPDWETKFQDEKILEKWKNEIRLQAMEKTDVVEDVIDYVLAELDWYRRVQNTWPGLKDGGFKVVCDDKITISDTAVSAELKAELQTLASQLYEAFDQLDYHPGSNDQVVDLVHPSLYCLQYDVTPIKKDDGTIAIAEFSDDITKVKKYVMDYGVSKNFQWLPSVMQVNSSGQFEFKSYINNLHPVKYADGYKTIASVFNAAVPGLNFTLSRFASPQFIRIDVPEYDAAYNQEYHDKHEILEAALTKEEEETGTYDWEKIEIFEDSKADYLVPITAKWEHDPETKDIDLRKFDNLKVVVKMANIELTPENSTYGGGSWHVEGTINEDIIATVLYYYDSENISESRLSFRCAFEDPNYDQGDVIYCKKVYGVDDGDKMTRNIGSVEAVEDRLLIFPNGYQHHVDPFELTDKTKNGHRKILCFFVCDPHNKHVVATDKVPPQQEEWWNDETIRKELLAEELRTQILDAKKGTEWPISLDGIKAVRTRLMEERSVSVAEDEYDDGAYQREFSLCEH